MTYPDPYSRTDPKSASWVADLEDQSEADREGGW